MLAAAALKVRALEDASAGGVVFAVLDEYNPY